MTLKKLVTGSHLELTKYQTSGLKNLDELHDTIACLMTDIVKHPEKCPHWLTEGLTYLLPKTNDTRNPKNYRPITYLPTMYKLLTSIITDRTYLYLEYNKMLPTE